MQVTAPNRPSRTAREHIVLSRDLIVETLRLTPSRKLSIQLLRSFIVSAIALIFDFGLLIVLKQSFGINYLLAATLSFLVGVVVNYVLSVLWVFPDHKMASRRTEMGIFFVITAIGLGLNLAIIAVFVQAFTVDYRIAKIISTVVVFFWNFIARKKILY